MVTDMYLEGGGRRHHNKSGHNALISCPNESNHYNICVKKNSTYFVVKKSLNVSSNKWPNTPILPANVSSGFPDLL